MDKKTRDIVKAAWAMFARYGYAKTTMSDIAQEAGVARQTLYNAFSSKEDMLRAVVRMAGEESLAAVRQAWADARELEQKLTTFQELGPRSWYEAMRVMPDWAALMDGMNAAAADELTALEAEWVSAIEQMLARETGNRVPPETLTEVARFLYSASKNAKYGVEDVEGLDQRLATIRKAALALLSG